MQNSNKGHNTTKALKIGDSIDADSNQPQNLNTKSLSSAQVMKERAQNKYGDYPETEDERVVN